MRDTHLRKRATGLDGPGEVCVCVCGGVIEVLVTAALSLESWNSHAAHLWRDVQPLPHGGLSNEHPSQFPASGQEPRGPSRTCYGLAE